MYKPGDVIGELTLIEKIPYKIPNGKTKSKWLCQCSCGKITQVFASNLNKTKSCGHLTKKRLSETHLKNMIGLQFGRLKVLSRAPDRISSSGRRIVQWNCLCACGNTVTVDGFELRKGTIVSCGCYAEENNNNKSENLINQKFGKLTVIAKADSRKYGKISMSCWTCKCECGSVINVLGTVLRRGQISCGCVNSKAEELIANILSNKKIVFYKQYTFSDLKSDLGYELPFDFAIVNNNTINIIEHHGVQHYIPQSNHFGDYQREVTDKVKQQYCIERNIPFYIIAYNEDIEQRLNQILSVIFDNTVPSRD